jgi:nucleoside diphosphate kinase
VNNKAICIIKPDGLDHVQEIREYLKTIGILIIEEWYACLDIADVRYMYPSLEERPDAFQRACNSMTSQEVIVMVCSGDSVHLILKQAKVFLRGTYMKNNPKGVIHASETLEEALREVEYFSKLKKRSP